MDKEICFLFPGQGAQYPGMGRDFHTASPLVRELFQMASDLVGVNTESLLFDSTEADLKKTEHTQIAITLMNLSVRRFLEERGLGSSGAAGFSLGEFSALVDGEVLTEEAVFPLVLQRGIMMARAVEEDSLLASESGMAAVIGLSGKEIEAVIAPLDRLYCANYNAPAQTVISGLKSSLEEATELLKEAGARRIIPLKVSGPFHTPLLGRAREEFEVYLKGISFADPVKPLFSNVTGGIIADGEEARRLCGLQIVSPVRWTEVEASIAAAGMEIAVEVGPGKVLTGLWKSGAGAGSCFSTDTVESSEKLFEEES